MAGVSGPGESSATGGIQVAQDLDPALARRQGQAAPADAETIGGDLEDHGNRCITKVLDFDQSLDAVAVVGVAAGCERGDRHVVGRAAVDHKLARHAGLGFGAGGQGCCARGIDRAVGEDQDPRPRLAGEGTAGQPEGTPEVGLAGPRLQLGQAAAQGFDIVTEGSGHRDIEADGDHQGPIDGPEGCEFLVGTDAGAVEAAALWIVLAGAGHARRCINNDRQGHRVAQPNFGTRVAEGQAQQRQQHQLQQPRQHASELAPQPPRVAFTGDALPQRREWDDDLAPTHPQQVQRRDGCGPGEKQRGQLGEGPPGERHRSSPPCRNIRRTKVSNGTSISARK